MEAKELRRAIVEELKRRYITAAAEIEGAMFSGADIAMSDGEGNRQVFRLIVVEHGGQTSTDEAAG